MQHGKRVHFIDPVTNNVVYPDQSVISSTPSPSFSISSLPSSSLPSTPSSAGFYYIPLPPAGIIQQIHPAISCSNGRTAPFQFDITVAPSQLADPVPQKFGKGGWLFKCSRPPAQQSPLTGRSPSPICFDLSLLDDPVTYPLMNSIILFSDILPWSTPVGAEIPGGAVTIYDVLESLHTSLRTPISKSEWDHLSAHTQNSVSAAFYRRLGGIRDHSLREKQFRRGVRRLDFLLGNTKLLGIAAVPGKPGVFTLHWGSAH